jgi:hypothetical protein
LPTHWLGVDEAPAALLPEPLVPAEDEPEEPEEPVAPDEPVEPDAPEEPVEPDEPELPELMLGLLALPEVPELPELPLVWANAALARKAEKTAALISFNVMEMSPVSWMRNCEPEGVQSQCRGHGFVDAPQAARSIAPSTSAGSLWCTM